MFSNVKYLHWKPEFWRLTFGLQDLPACLWWSPTVILAQRFEIKICVLCYAIIMPSWHVTSFASFFFYKHKTDCTFPRWCVMKMAMIMLFPFVQPRNFTPSFYSRGILACVYEKTQTGISLAKNCKRIKSTEINTRRLDYKRNPCDVYEFLC